MYAQLSPSHLLQLIIITTIFINLFIIQSSYGEDDEQFRQCTDPDHLYSCGRRIRGIRYPFWGGSRPSFCGLEGFELKCQPDEYTTIAIASQTFRVLGINQSMHALTIARNDLWDDICPEKFDNTTLDETLFAYCPEVLDLNLFYNCPPSVLDDVSVRDTFPCRIDGVPITGFYGNESILSSLQLPNSEPICRINMTVPVYGPALSGFRDNGSMTIQELLNQGFPVEYIDFPACSACEESGGTCWSSTNSSQPTCLCRDGPQPLVCPVNRGGEINWRRKIIIGFGTSGVSILLMGIIFFFWYKRNKKRYVGSSHTSRNISSYSSSMLDVEKSGIYFGVHVFAYGELEEATNNFDSNKELGDGGFGTVYQGKLQDGRVVAVKRLYENNFKRVEQFMNEVEILTRLRHKNLVSLYGCTSRHCRELLLVYEYIPNGTVADHLHGERAKPGLLSWATRMSIAIETASALRYLHASDVIHRDVKTNNILLDNNFCVKVADFGLSRFFPNDVTHVSTAPQGTPGYVDPEYHECYQLTDKSDVYSFGVVLIELISSKPAVDITRHRHEINLSTMAINKIQNHALHELVDPCLGFESDYKVRKMIYAVAELAFQCLQNGKEMRPSMEEVLEDLKGIQSKDYKCENEQEVDIQGDDDVLLKNNPQMLSPDSVTVKWISRSTTPNSSG